tara:strand:- start:334 stop:831 length:498 start_codon:yes stop_codon:yes gene_type:complete
MKLINGKGQLGAALVQQKLGSDNDDVIIYHTWEVSNKSLEAQKDEYTKFTEFVDKYKHSLMNIVFISTKSENDTWYTFYKQKAEGLLLQSGLNVKILRLPTFVGKPCKLFEPNATAWGNLELISIDNAATQIIYHAKQSFDKNRIININGEIISAQLVVDILKTK